MNAFASTALVVVVLVSGCESAAPIEPDAIRVTTVEAAVTFPAAPSLSRYEAGAPIASLADDDGTPIAATPAGPSALVALDGTTLAPVELIADADGPATTGAVHAFARRADGLLLSADAGLFHTFAGALLWSPASDALAGASALAVVRGDDGEIVYAAMPDGLHRLSATAHERIAIPDESSAPSALAANSSVVLVAHGDRLYELALDDLTVREVPAELGSIDHATAAGERLIACGQGGLVVREADGSYVRHAGLGPVLALTADAYGIAYARIAGGIVRLDPSGPVGFAPAPSSAVGYVGLALDRDGHVWLGEGSALVRLATGKVVSFAADIAPILEARCATCHEDGERAPRRDFTDYDVVLALSEAIFTRISTGLMPPPPNAGPDAAEYDLLVRWYAGERAP